MKSQPNPYTNPYRSFQPGMTRLQVVGCLAAFCCLAFVWVAVLYYGKYKEGANRSFAILNVRNAQQAMRGYQCMRSVYAGDPFTREQLEEFMPYPASYEVKGGMVAFGNTGLMMGDSEYPAKNDDHLWLKIIAPETEGNVGKYGFNDIADTTDW